jgi:group II intron reverse transcriptase/maturase
MPGSRCERALLESGVPRISRPEVATRGSKVPSGKTGTLVVKIELRDRREPALMLRTKRKHHSLIDKVYSPRNLRSAWEKVRANKGCAGVDRQSVRHFEKHAERYLAAIHQQLKSGSYSPKAVLRVWIPKPDGRKRPLGIPTVADRVVQQAVLNVIGPIFERKFMDTSHGFRPGRSTHTALRKMWLLIKGGRRWIVDADIKGYFDTIPHERLVDFVAEEVADGKVLALVRQFLSAKVMEDLELKDVELGTPQGGVISPLLANIYLHYFDAKMKDEGYEIIRYADDFVILCRTEAAARAAQARMKQILEGELDLTVHPEKTRVVHVSKGFDFLGYTIRWQQSLYAKPREKSLERFKEKVRLLTRRQQPIRLSDLIRKLNRTLRGWGNYYRKAHVKNIFWKLDLWIEKRIRAFIAKKWRSEIWREYPYQLLRDRYGLVSLWKLCPRPAHP